MRNSINGFEHFPITEMSASRLFCHLRMALRLMTWHPRQWAQHSDTAIDLPYAWWLAGHSIDLIYEMQKQYESTVQVWNSRDHKAEKAVALWKGDRFALTCYEQSPTENILSITHLKTGKALVYLDSDLAERCGIESLLIPVLETETGFGMYLAQKIDSNPGLLTELDILSLGDHAWAFKSTTFFEEAYNFVTITCREALHEYYNLNP